MAVSRLLHVPRTPQPQVERAQADQSTHVDDSTKQDGSGQAGSFQDALAASLDRQKTPSGADVKVHKQEKPGDAPAEHSAGEADDGAAAAEQAPLAKVPIQPAGDVLVEEPAVEEKGNGVKKKDAPEGQGSKDDDDTIHVPAVAAAADRATVTPAAPAAKVDEIEKRAPESAGVGARIIPETLQAAPKQAAGPVLSDAGKRKKLPDAGKAAEVRQPKQAVDHADAAMPVNEQAQVNAPADAQTQQAVQPGPADEHAEPVQKPVHRTNAAANGGGGSGARHAEASEPLPAQGAPAAVAPDADTSQVVVESGRLAASSDAKAGDGKPVVNVLAAADVPKVGGAAVAEAARGAQDSPRADAPELLDQVVLGLKGKLDARTGKAEIRMDPPNLGTVKVSVSLEQGQLTAQFHSASEVVRNLLKDNLEKLKTVLESQGVTVDRLAVDAPADARNAATGQQGQQASFGSAAHDGRSAGGYQQDARSRQRSTPSESFSRLFEQTKEKPLDLVA